MARRSLDAQKLYELGSHPGTFPEMLQSVYREGLEASKEEERRRRKEVMAALYSRNRGFGWSVEGAMNYLQEHRGSVIGSLELCLALGINDRWLREAFLHV